MGRRRATLRRSKATHRRASGNRRRASRGTRSCRKVLRRGHLKAMAAHRLIRLTRSKAAARSATGRPRRISNKVARRPPTRLTLSSKRRRRSSTVGHRRPSTAVLRAATEVRRLNTAVRPRSSSTVRLRANRSMALCKDNSLTAVALPRKGNNTARRRPNNHPRTTAHPPTQPAPTARRLDPRDRRTEFAETIIPTFAETYRDML